MWGYAPFRKERMASPVISPERDSLLLLHAPVGRDAQLLHGLLGRAQLQSRVCSSIDDLCGQMERGAGAVMVTEEALQPARDSGAVVRSQQDGPSSDLPLVVLTIGGEPTEASRRRLFELEPLGELTLLERPLRSDTIVSAARTALRTRIKQYEVRRRDAELQLVTDNVPVLISYIDRGQVFRRVNHTFYEWFGLHPQEVVGRTIQTIAGEPHYTSVQPFIARALEGERVSLNRRSWISDMNCGT